MILPGRQDTIIAPATPPGEGGIGILRLSGPNAEDLLRRFFVGRGGTEKLAPRFLHLGQIQTPGGEIVDEVMAVVMPGPQSYTREDVVEVHCHGGRLVLQGILDLFLEAGARLAEPGEFTLRAFLNGRLDLAQAEAVADLIRSRSEGGRHIALGQLQGKLSRVVRGLRDRLLSLVAEVEAWIDFPEEDLSLAGDQFSRQALDVLEEIRRLLSRFDEGRILREGLSVLILGKPNVGKSSLLNALVGEARAIVTEIPGTTRDIIEERLQLEGVALRLIDSAGVRETADPIEEEGVRRAREKVLVCDLVLLTLDGSRPTGSEDLLALESCQGQRTVVVLNKADLPQIPPGKPFDELPMVAVSAHHGIGLDALRRTIKNICFDAGAGDPTEDVLVSDRRHREALLVAQKGLDHFLAALEEGAPAELVAFELRESLDALGRITGDTGVDSILGEIFSRFCIGK